jgi:hypothetical protein
MKTEVDVNKAFDGSIARYLSRGPQSWELLHIFEAASGQRFKVEIDRDSYDNQCSARIERWDGSQWQLVHWLPIAQMAVLEQIDNGAGRPIPLVSYGRQELSQEAIEAFAADEGELIRVALEVSPG